LKRQAQVAFSCRRPDIEHTIERFRVTKMKRISVLLLLIAFVCTLLSCSAAGPDKPDIQVVDLKGLEAALAEHRGEGVLLNFWAIWCQPCLAELPDLVEVAREFRGRGGTVLGVSYDLMVPDATRDEVLKQMNAFAAERNIDIPILVYEAADYDSIDERFALPGPIPVTLAIDREGNIVDREEGESQKDRFVAMMQKAIKGVGPGHLF
jgi:thiol-disulfide isomerase/thioredoxin